MGPEFWVGIAAVFVSGGALGAGGALLTQWMVRKLQGDDHRLAHPTDRRAMELLRAEVRELSETLASVDQRLDFTEQLLEGAIPLSRPTPLEPPDQTEDLEA